MRRNRDYLDSDTADRIRGSFADPAVRRRKAAEIREIRRDAERKERDLRRWSEGW